MRSVAEFDRLGGPQEPCSHGRSSRSTAEVEADRCSRTRGRDGAGYRCRFRVRPGRCR
jgi:hypothetical protein